MPVLTRLIDKQAKGSFAEREDWWHLCYDTENRAFYIEHEWNHMDAYKSGKKPDAGTALLQIEGYSGPGAVKLDEAKASLLAEAGHA